MRDEKQNTSRRAFLQKLTALGTAGVITPVVLSACGGGDATDTGGTTAESGEGAADFSCTDTSGLTDAQIQQRENTNYVDYSPNHPEQVCSNCQLYTLPEAGAQCGGCQVVPGPIHPDGYCDLWVAAQV
jgi:hypothetical protein